MSRRALVVAIAGTQRVRFGEHDLEADHRPQRSLLPGREIREQVTFDGDEVAAVADGTAEARRLKAVARIVQVVADDRDADVFGRTKRCARIESEALHDVLVLEASGRNARTERTEPVLLEPQKAASSTEKKLL